MSASDLCDYIWASPSPFHCVEESARRLTAAGFVPLLEGGDPQNVTPGSTGFLIRGGTLVAWRAGTDSPAVAGFRMLGAHTDSPNLRIKPRPEYLAEGYVQWGIEPYGGVLLATWTDRDLGLSGRVTVRTDQGLKTHLFRDDRPLARVTNLAIHLNRKVNDEGLKLNKQTHLPPLVAQVPELEGPGLLLGLLASTLNVQADDILGWDLGLHDVQKPTVGGLNEDFVFAPRLDNQGSCYTALQALIQQTEPTAHTQVVALFDHEEVGSGSDRGAASTLLRNLLVRLERDHTISAPGGIERAVANSFMVSADMAHGVHPNYADKHDKHHRPTLNGGPVIKTNVNMRYATDAETAARFRAACEAEAVPYQEFINRSDLACGSTIGPISAAGLAVPGLDVGCAMLSMHSIRECAGARDVEMMTAVMRRILLEG
ncbi:MAG: aspartyl aminopeptidase [Myxococcota bacterium]|jgi:aspartyl aminopeptidase